MEKDLLFKILGYDPISFTLDEIEAMMDDEMNCDPAEMDCELIELCADILENAYLIEKSNGREIKKSIRSFEKLLITAAV